MIYVNHNGEIVFNSGTQEFAPLLNGSAKAGFAVNRDNSLLVINDGTNVLQFFDITWNDGVPTLTPKYSYKASLTGSGIQQMAFDYAGNVAEGFDDYMDLSRLPNGIYIVKVNNFNGVRIIKQ